MSRRQPLLDFSSCFFFLISQVFARSYTKHRKYFTCLFFFYHLQSSNLIAFNGSKWATKQEHYKMWWQDRSKIRAICVPPCPSAQVSVVSVLSALRLKSPASVKCLPCHSSLGRFWATALASLDLGLFLCCSVVGVPVSQCYWEH